MLLPSGCSFQHFYPTLTLNIDLFTQNPKRSSVSHNASVLAMLGENASNTQTHQQATYIMPTATLCAVAEAQ